MAKISTKTRVRRTDDQLIADLQAKIAQVKRRAEARQAKKDPALRHISAALRSIGKAEKESKDPATREALDDARATLSACLSLNRAAPSSNGSGHEEKPKRSAASVDATALLNYVRKSPGSRGEAIAFALRTTSDSMRPAMKKLIEAGDVRTEGQRRGMTYHPA